MTVTLYRGFVIHSQNRTTVEYLPDGALAVDAQGHICGVGLYNQLCQQFSAAREITWPNAILLPGLVDTHVHLPQYPAAALGQGELLDWLNTYIFPLEAQFADPQIAKQVAVRFFDDALAHGTCAMAVYCTSHYQATDIAFAAAQDSGIRACMGNSMMDRQAPSNLLLSTTENIQTSLKLAAKWHNANRGKLQYVFTPRFAGSCTPELLQQCGDIARAEHFRIQSHLAENPQELAYIASLYPNIPTYTEVYDHYGLLTERTIMAHGVYLTPTEQQLLHTQQCAIAHCPVSNRFLQSGVMPLRHYLQAGLRLGLGTDIAGGYSLSLLHEAREAIESSKTWNLLHRDAEAQPLTPEEALWLATLGGAEALHLDSQIGNFAVGKEADFIVVQPPDMTLPQLFFSEPRHLLTNLIYSNATTVLQTFIQGECVYSK